MVIAITLVMLLAGCASYPEVRIGECMGNEGFVVGCDSSSAKYKVVKTWHLENMSNYPSDEFLSYDGQCPPEYTNTFIPTRDSWDQGDRNVSCLRDIAEGKSDVPYTQTTVTSKINVGDCLYDDGYAVRCDSSYARFYVIYSHWMQDSVYPQDEFQWYSDINIQSLGSNNRY